MTKFYDLAADNIQKGLISVLVGFALVLIFMAWRYRVFGLVANLALTLNLITFIKMLAIKWIKILTRLILYILLFAFFCYFYMIEQMSDYIKGRTTVTSRFEEVEYLEPPTITLCMHPLFKPTKMAASGLTDQYDVLFTDFTNDTGGGI